MPCTPLASQLACLLQWPLHHQNGMFICLVTSVQPSTIPSQVLLATVSDLRAAAFLFRCAAWAAAYDYERDTLLSKADTMIMPHSPADYCRSASRIRAQRPICGRSALPQLQLKPRVEPGMQKPILRPYIAAHSALPQHGSSDAVKSFT